MKNIDVFTDGSFMKKNKILCGYGVHFPNKELPDISRSFKHPPCTNQRAELYAIYVAIVTIKKHIPDFDEIHIYTDSDYSIQTLTKWMYKWAKNNWQTADKQPVKNLDIIRDLLYDVIGKRKNKITFTHVYSHTGKKDKLSIGNEMADKLATSGALKMLRY